MHVPDGFINAPVSVAAGAVAVGAVAVSLRGARRELEERTAPLAGLVAAFIFAVQMLNFPVGAGTSGHLLGGALAAILAGPYTAVLCISVVLLMQSVLFADGGLTALGVNITDMGVVGVLVAYVVFRGLLKLLPSNRSSVTGAAFVAALVSVPAAAAAFTAFYAIGGTTNVALGEVLTAMLGVHVLIGIGEAVITALTVGAVLSVRPDLVHGARGLTTPLTLRTPTSPTVPGGATSAEPATQEGSAAPTAAPAAATRDDATQAAVQDTAKDAAQDAAGDGADTGGQRTPRSSRRVWYSGLAATLLCAGIVSFYASANPDGLEKVAAEYGIDEEAVEHHLSDWPFAGYGVADITNARLSGGLAGAIGAGATLAVGSGVFVVVRRRRAATTASSASSASSTTSTASPGSAAASSASGGGDTNTSPGA